MDLVSILEKEGAICNDGKPIDFHNAKLPEAFSIIDVPFAPRNGEHEFTIYTKVQTPDQRTLVQQPGRVYHAVLKDGKIVYRPTETSEEIPFAVMGFYPRNYFFAQSSYIKRLQKKFR